MPSMSIQYAVISYALSAFLLVFAVRTLLRLLANLATRRSDVWIRNLLTLVAAILLEVILGAPYWLMNIATPYVYGIVWSSLLLTAVGIAFLSRRNAQAPRLKLFKVVAVVIAAVLIVQVAIGAFYFFNWNNNYLTYSWYPQTQKQITVTRWSAGLDAHPRQQHHQPPDEQPFDDPRTWSGSGTSRPRRSPTRRRLAHTTGWV